MTLEKIRFRHFGVAFLPLLLTPVLVYALAEGWLNAGGGEKDILLAIPYILLSSIFLVSAVVLILKRWDLRRWVARSAIISISAIVVVWIIAFMTSSLGIA